MAVSKAENEALMSVAQQLVDISTGISGNRRRELVRLAGVIETVAKGSGLDEIEVKLGEKASTPAVPTEAIAAQNAASPSNVPSPVVVKQDGAPAS